MLRHLQLELSAEAKRERLALRDTLATQAEDVLAMQGALEEKLASGAPPCCACTQQRRIYTLLEVALVHALTCLFSEIYAMRQVLEAESGAPSTPVSTHLPYVADTVRVRGSREEMKVQVSARTTERLDLDSDNHATP